MPDSKSSATLRRRRNPLWRPNFGSAARLASVPTAADDANDDVCDPVPGPRMFRVLLSSDWTTFCSLFAFRALNALVIQTSFVPDEFWQSVEVAHNMAFGYGYLTWEWVHGLRSYSYPLLFASVYKVLALLHIDNRLLLIKLPRLMQALCAAIGDLYVYKLTQRISGRRAAYWTLVCQLTSWFMFYCCTRTLTNSMEAVLTSVALYYFPWPAAPRMSYWKFIVPMCLAVVVRPTSAITWLPLTCWLLYQQRQTAWRIVKYFIELGFLVLLLTSVIDRLFYGRWVNVQYNFLKFNVLSDMGRFYGVHPVHWYLTQGLGVVLATHLLILLAALWWNVQPVFLAVIGWSVAVYSALSHKEFRFLLGILPLMMHVCGCTLYQLVRVPPANKLSPAAATENTDPTKGDAASVNKESETVKLDACSQNTSTVRNLDKCSNSPVVDMEAAVAGEVKCGDAAQEKVLCQASALRRSRVWKTLILACLLGVNVPIALYTSLIHQRGTVDVMTYLVQNTKEESSILFLMPCHSTPFYSYLHRNISMRFLTCEPNLLGSNDHRVEADDFYSNPSAWLNSNYFNSSLPSAGNNTGFNKASGASALDQAERHGVHEGSLPTHVVMFDALHKHIWQELKRHAYQLCHRAFHTHFPEGRVSSFVIVMCR